MAPSSHGGRYNRNRFPPADMVPDRFRGTFHISSHHQNLMIKCMATQPTAPTAESQIAIARITIKPSLFLMIYPSSLDYGYRAYGTPMDSRCLVSFLACGRGPICVDRIWPWSSWRACLASGLAYKYFAWDERFCRYLPSDACSSYRPL